MSKETSFIIQTEKGYSWGITIEQECRLEGASKKYPDKRAVKAFMNGHEESFEKASERLAWAAIKVSSIIQEKLREVQENG